MNILMGAHDLFYGKNKKLSVQQSTEMFDLLKTKVVKCPYSMESQTFTLPHFGGHKTIIQFHVQMVTQQGASSSKCLSWFPKISKIGGTPKSSSTFQWIFLVYGGFLSHTGTPESSIYRWIFPYKPSILGYPHGYGNPARRSPEDLGTRRKGGAGHHRVVLAEVLHGQLEG